MLKHREVLQLCLQHTFEIPRDIEYLSRLQEEEYNKFLQVSVPALPPCCTPTQLTPLLSLCACARWMNLKATRSRKTILLCTWVSISSSMAPFGIIGVSRGKVSLG